MALDLSAGQMTTVVDTVLFGIDQEQTLNILWTSILMSPGRKSYNIISFSQIATSTEEMFMGCTHTWVILAFYKKKFYHYKLSECVNALLIKNVLLIYYY